ncbi:MAG: hypothetical protein JWQ03_1636 [Variovorax sp.]|nr:hypothetical protein [Variovorax sp.]
MVSQPFQTIEKLFGRMELRYGYKFLERWEGLSLTAVKEDWRLALAGLSEQQLQYGLAHLPPSFPPDAGEFAKICASMPRTVEATKLSKLPPPRGRMELRPEIRAAVAHLLEPPAKGEEPNRLKVARRFVAMWDGKEHLSIRQKEDLAHFKRVIERFENVRANEERTTAAKAATQQAVDNYQPQEQGHGTAAEH